MAKCVTLSLPSMIELSYYLYETSFRSVSQRLISGGRTVRWTTPLRTGAVRSYPKYTYHPRHIALEISRHLSLKVTENGAVCRIPKSGGGTKEPMRVRRVPYPCYLAGNAGVQSGKGDDRLRLDVVGDHRESGSTIIDGGCSSSRDHRSGLDTPAFTIVSGDGVGWG